ncbi:SH3 domain-containing protein [Nocardioides panacis]|uniref:SH3 domain-containing protein n=1 Tax=Nocardioides panacis TaxID=2849501 RepID=A0A975XYR4_9ACTN|nr:SH3 domain-containing protein [Nocardioides panacis]QWZ06484.1 SH3 domain-containing protein [Nocardioides panacis]
MTSARHRQVVQHSTRRRFVRLALPAAAATLLTGTVVGLAVGAGAGADTSQAGASVGAAADPMTVDLDAATGAARTGTGPAVGGSTGTSTGTSTGPTTGPMNGTASGDRSPYLAGRVSSFSRSAKRVTLHKKPEVRDREYMTSDLNLWDAPREKGKPLDVLDAGDTVGVTGLVKRGFAQILLDGQVRWVNDDYLSEKKPVAPEPAATGTSGAGAGSVSFAPCADGTATESGLTSSAVRMFRAVCNAFPALSSFGGYDAHGEHSSGRAVDFMTSDPALGQAVADWARAHASELDLYDVLWSQHIWTPVRSAEGWRSMPDRGSSTANHYDHVHISVN